ncbi:MAG: hypothetical protein EOO39_40400, partial [Cytophagaceae bacterium]
AIFMPRWACRITLEITNIRVERLNEITAEDAVAEGVTFDYLPAADPNSAVKPEGFNDWDEQKRAAYIDGLSRAIYMAQCENSDRAYDAFHELWDSINGADKTKNWEANPWVWSISVKKLEGVQNE